MKCAKCGQLMNPSAIQTLEATVKDERFEVQIVAPQCSGCGRVVLDRKARRAYHRAGSDAFRSQHGLLTSKELDELRRNLGMTWKGFAEFVSVGIATLKRWMGGEIQSPSLDTLVRLKTDLSFLERAANELALLLAGRSSVEPALTVSGAKPMIANRRQVRFEQDAPADQYAAAA